tara:strand:+ start:377 stop:652 length:276 start_codon:yes stop_codon:yes gene_type:complete
MLGRYGEMKKTATKIGADLCGEDTVIRANMCFEENGVNNALFRLEWALRAINDTTPEDAVELDDACNLMKDAYLKISTYVRKNGGQVEKYL